MDQPMEDLSIYPSFDKLAIWVKLKKIFFKAINVDKDEKQYL